eukprot:scaffold539_cov359-Prasinococcus_capsulatus_cf.AAC.11
MSTSSDTPMQRRAWSLPGNRACRSRSRTCNAATPLATCAPSPPARGRRGGVTDSVHSATHPRRGRPSPRACRRWRGHPLELPMRGHIDGPSVTTAQRAPAPPRGVRARCSPGPSNSLLPGSAAKSHAAASSPICAPPPPPSPPHQSTRTPSLLRIRSVRNGRCQPLHDSRAPSNAHLHVRVQQVQQLCLAPVAALAQLWPPRVGPMGLCVAIAPRILLPRPLALVAVAATATATATAMRSRRLPARHC